MPPKIARKKRSEVIHPMRGDENGGILLRPLGESAVIRLHRLEGREGKSRVPLLRGENEGSILGRHHLFEDAIKKPPGMAIISLLQTSTLGTQIFL